MTLLAPSPVRDDTSYPGDLDGLRRRLLRGRPEDPRWVRPALLGLLGATALLYLWGLGASGWANSFYSAAVQAGAHSWKAFFFGSFDSANAITVDKPPASLWVMDLSARLVGVNAWSILVPQALEGVAAVGLLYLTVRRRFPASAALLAGAVLATTPVAVLMFRYNNPDALLTLLLVAGGYSLVRALGAASWRWLALAGALVGIGFLTKMLQAFLVVPVFAGVYLLAAPTALGNRVRHLLGAGLALLVTAGWWVAVVTLWPAAGRPYIGGSQHNSILELVLGYNGLGRLTGQETGSVGGGPVGSAGRWGATGWTRLFGAEMGTQVSWLLPAALILLAALLWLTRRAPRTEGRRAQVLVWGGWLVVTGLTFSFARGIIHPYYTVALAPAVGALVGIGAVGLWARRDLPAVRAVLAVTVAATGLWTWQLLGRSPAWLPWLRPAVLVVALAVGAALLAGPWPGRAGRGLAAAAVLTGLLAPAASAVQTAATPHTGALPTAGPAVAGGRFGPGGPGGGQGLRGLGRLPANGGPAFRGGAPAFPGGGPAFPGGARASPGAAGGPRGGLLDVQRPSAALVSLLRSGRTGHTWAAATVGAMNAAGVQLDADVRVLAVGGFNGSDPYPSLAQFQSLVAAGKVHYFLGGGGLGMGPGRGGSAGSSSAVAAWVQEHFTATTVGGTTVYDLTVPTGSTQG